MTDRAREELEKPIPKISKDKRPLDEFREQQTISDDITQHLFNNKDIRYINESTDIFKLLRAFWNCNWLEMRKIVNSSLSQPNIKKNTPLVYYQLKLSEAWIFFQLGKIEQAINIWKEIEKECPKDYPHIRKLALISLQNLMFTEYDDREKDETRYQELQEYNDITIVDSSIHFNKSNVLSTINKEFDFKNGKTRSLGQTTRQFFLYDRYLLEWMRSFLTVLEKGMFFILPELIEDLIDLAIMQYQYYGEGNKQYFFMLHNIARNINGFNTNCLERYFNILELWDLQNYTEEIQPLINSILSSNELKSVDLKFLKIIIPILNNEQQSKTTQYARTFFENPKVPYGDNYNTFGLWGEYLKTYFTILELNQSLWEAEQEWIITRLCNIAVIEYNNPIHYIERLIKKTQYLVEDELLDKLCELIKSQKDYMGTPISEYDVISRISNLYAFYNKKLPPDYQYIFRKHQSLWLYSNHYTMPEITSEDINQAFKYIEYTINEYYKHDQKTTFPQEYYNIPQYISLYVSLIKEYKDRINFELSYSDIEKLWTEFLDFCLGQETIPFKLLIEIQSFLIYFASEKKFEKYRNIEHYMDFEKWEDKVKNYSMHDDDEKNIATMNFLGGILHHIYNINDVDINSFHELLNTVTWHKYRYCIQGIVNWRELIPKDIKQLLKIKLLDIISLSRRELIDTNIIFVYEMLFTDEEDIKSLEQFKGICSFPLYYEIEKNI